MSLYFGKILGYIKKKNHLLSLAVVAQERVVSWVKSSFVTACEGRVLTQEQNNNCIQSTTSIKSLDSTNLLSERNGKWMH